MGVKRNPDLGKEIKDMEVGEEGRALTTALAFDKEGVPYLDLSKTAYGEKYGEFKMPIKRIGPRESDYEVDTDFASYDVKWTKEENPHSYANDSDVVELDSAVEENDEESMIMEEIKKTFDSKSIEKVMIGNTEIAISEN